MVLEGLHPTRRGFLGIAPAAVLLAACSKQESKLKLALNWKPDPQFGGFYAANFASKGLDVEILPGGAGTPTVQMIGAGSAEFGIVSADEIVLARAQGNEVVGLFAVYQTCPQGIMVHSKRGLQSIGEVTKDGTLAIQKGLPYARLMERKFPFDKVKVVPSPGGDITAFLADENMAQQCFVMSEPLAAKHKGASVRVFPVADLGYNPYTTVLATSASYLAKNEERAQAMVATVRDGWRSYLDNPKPVNDRMRQLNPSMDEATFAEVAEAQKPYVESEDTRAMGLGIMTEQRWEALVAALKDLGDITADVDPKSCFRSL